MVDSAGVGRGRSAVDVIVAAERHAPDSESLAANLAVGTGEPQLDRHARLAGLAGISNAIAVGIIPHHAATEGSW